ncbi:Rv3235 family protein [Streptomyces sp. NPDC048187]|uniref:Rv3235 family protein n=1 Tax=Streptomyces sp. NPDC048187 TaxID=3365509 RepID=UPI003711AE68
MRKVMTRTQLRPSRPPLDTPNGSPASPAPYSPSVSTTPYDSSAPPAAYGAGAGAAPRPPGRTAPDGRADGLSPALPGPPPRRPGAEAADPARTPPRVPGGLPPRRPGGRATRATAPGGRPPGSPGRSQRSRTRPADTRPPTPGQVRATGTGPAAPAGTSGRPAPARRPFDAPAGTHPVLPSTAPLVPAQTPRRPVPQLRPTDHFAELLLGVLSGRRPVHSMLRHTVGHAYDDLADLAERGPLRTRGAAPVVRDIGYFEPRPGALEVFARIGAGDRLRAMAFRLEQGRDLRWRCTAVELGGHRRTHADDD